MSYQLDLPSHGVAFGILTLLVARGGPTRTKTIMQQLASEDYSKSTIYGTLAALHRQGLILRISKHKMVEYVTTQRGQEYLHAISTTSQPSQGLNITIGLADAMVEWLFAELPPQQRTSEMKQKMLEACKDKIKERMRQPLFPNLQQAAATETL